MSSHLIWLLIFLPLSFPLFSPSTGVLVFIDFYVPGLLTSVPFLMIFTLRLLLIPYTLKFFHVAVCILTCVIMMIWKSLTI